jgi:hypothetical protein
VLALVALHLLPTGCNPVRDPVSRYALSRYGALDGAQKFAGGVCTLSLAGALALLRAPVPGVGIMFLTVNGLALLLLVTVPAESEEAQKGALRSRRWVLHSVLALVSFTTIALAAGVLTAPILGWPAWHGVTLLLIITGIWTPIAVVLFFAAFGIAQWRPFLGLFQRAIYLGTICWLGAVLIPLAR